MTNIQNLTEQNNHLKKEVAKLRELNQKLYTDQAKYVVRDAERSSNECACVDPFALNRSTAGPRGMQRQCANCSNWISDGK